MHTNLEHTCLYNKRSTTDTFDRLHPLHTELLQYGFCECTFSFHLTYSSFLRGLVRSMTLTQSLQGLLEMGEEGRACLVVAIFDCFLTQMGILVGEDQDVKSPANWQAVLQEHKLPLPCLPFKYQDIHVSGKTVYSYLSLELNCISHGTK